MLAERSIKLDHVIDIQVPDEVIVERIIGRFSCAKCGAMYHDKFNPTKTYGVCDACGSTEFARRLDDNRRTVSARLAKYRAMTAPVLPYYEEKGLLVCVDGTGPVDVVMTKIKNVIGC